MELGAAKEMTISALRVVGVLSVASAVPGHYGLAYGVRNQLADDSSMVVHLSRILESLAQPTSSAGV